MVGKSKFQEALPKDFITAKAFASDVLGFEEYKGGEMDANGGADKMLRAEVHTSRERVGIQAVTEEEGF